MNVNKIMQVTADYAVAIKAAFETENPPWEECDQFLGNVASLVGELSVETNLDVQMIALDHDWHATCFKSDMRWFDLTGQAVDEAEVFSMFKGGSWMVLTDGTEWR